MTVCKQLARFEKENGDVITAWERYEKDSRCPRYEITIAGHGSNFINYGDVIKCAKTTWKRKFNENIK